MPKTEWKLGDPTICVVGDRFCSPYPMEFVVKRKFKGLSTTNFDVYDFTGNLLLQIDGSIRNIHRKRVMRDPSGFVVLTIREKVLTMKHRMKIYQGDRCGPDDLLFSAKLSNAIKSSVDIFLANNLEKQVCDFHASGSYSNTSFKVYKGNALIARTSQVTHPLSWGSLCKGKDNFIVRVNPHVDYVFIVALLVIIDDNDNAI